MTSEHAVPHSQKPVSGLSRTPAMLLQRACACGGTAGASGECEACRKKRMAGRVQPRLAVNQPGDRWEQEAEWTAENVVSGCDAARHTPLARPALMRETGSGPAGVDAPANVGTVLNSRGEPLERRARTFMEDRFGYDFSRVRVHTDRQAAQSARDVGALAYTVGQHIVFGAGQYAPGSAAGNKLIAHELVHTLQQDQGMPALRRQATPFSIEGLYEGRAKPEENNFVYFDLERPTPADSPPESALDSAEEAKVVTRARAAVAANDQEITLYGYASEEGGAAHNNPLIERRLDAVEHVLNREGFSAPRVVHRTPNLACSAGKYDYRFWRAVEMQPGTGASTRVCTPTATQPTTCATDRAATLETLRTSALDLIRGTTGALARLDAYIQNAASEPAVAAALDKYFGNNHSTQTAQDVRARVDAVRVFLEALASGGNASFACGTMDEPTCRAGSPANTNRAARRITVCPSFFDDPDFSTRREEILIHESSHGSTSATDDRAYQAERVILILSTAQALENAQSITDFILELHGRSRTLGPENPDDVSGCSGLFGGRRREDMVREALAWAQRWNTYAMYGTAQTYGNAGRTAVMGPYIDAHFGRSDLAAIAGIYDRYRAMDGWFELFYNVRCVPGRDAACQGSRKVHWNLTGPVSPSGGGPVPQAGSSTAATPSSVSAGSTGASSSAAGAGSSQTASAPTGTPAATGSSSATAAASAGSSQASAAPAGDITVCPDFFRLGTLYDRVVEMYSGLAVHMPGTAEGPARSYARLAYNYKTEYWGVP